MTDSSTFGVSVYNFMQPTSGAYPHQKWINNNRDSYGIPNFVNFSQSNGQIYSAFAADISQSYSREVELLLTRLRVFIYVGQYDLIVNPAATYNFVNKLQWEGLTDWQRTSKQLWRRGNKTAGTVKDAGNLTLAVVYEAGHMVPTDQPESSMQLV
jgi:carboxypeptidase C (cathepsin A)